MRCRLMKNYGEAEKKDLNKSRSTGKGHWRLIQVLKELEGGIYVA